MDNNKQYPRDFPVCRWEALFELSRNAAEGGVQVGPESVDGDNDGNGYAGCD
jgi:hypothetical protein